MRQFVPIQLTSAAHCNRTVSGVSTSHYAETKKILDDGCSIQEITYVLRYPEVMLCDIGNPEYPLNLCDSQTIIDCYDLIQLELDRYLSNTALKRIYGDGLDTEIAICGPSNSELHKFKQWVLTEIYERLSLHQKISYIPYDGRGLHAIKNFTSLSPFAQRLNEHIVHKYKEGIIPEYWPQIKMFHLDKVYQNHRVWSQIAELGKNKLFVLTAGLSLALGYGNGTHDPHIYFTEVHRQNDPYQLYRRDREEEFNYSLLLPEEGDWIVIDKVYTSRLLHSFWNTSK